MFWDTECSWWTILEGLTVSESDDVCPLCWASLRLYRFEICLWVKYSEVAWCLVDFVVADIDTASVWSSFGGSVTSGSCGFLFRLARLLWVVGACSSRHCLSPRSELESPAMDEVLLSILYYKLWNCSLSNFVSETIIVELFGDSGSVSSFLWLRSFRVCIHISVRSSAKGYLLCLNSGSSVCSRKANLRPS